MEAVWDVPLSANHSVRTPFCESLKEVGEVTQVALTLILNPSLQITGQKRCCVFLAASRHSSEETVLVLETQKLMYTEP